MIDKRIALQEAAELVQSGQTLALGGLTLYRRPISFVWALLRRYLSSGEPQGLTLLAFTAGLESDLLVGSGMIKTIRSCYFGLEIFGLAPMFTYLANRGEVDIMEETEASLAFGLRAQLAGLNFMPGRGWLGTDLPKLRPDVKTICDPYSGETLMAFPAIQPDVAIIHALQADPAGNAMIGKNRAIDVELTMTAKTVIVTAEEIVPELDQADLVAPWVHAVVLAPRGAAPTSCHPYYPMDGEAVMGYSEQVSDPKSWSVYVRTRIDQG
ncbi:MAG: CoA transferase subunit A [Anaerolineales bacterium]|nr:CoA transferase subunit A [Anaerolineales bacterium]